MIFVDIIIKQMTSILFSKQFLNNFIVIYEDERFSIINNINNVNCFIITLFYIMYKKIKYDKDNIIKKYDAKINDEKELIKKCLILENIISSQKKAINLCEKDKDNIIKKYYAKINDEKELIKKCLILENIIKQ
jgi:hypothetical protein